MKKVKKVAPRPQNPIKIEQLQAEIESIDAGILDLLDRRMRLATEIWKMQRKKRKKVYDPTLEKEQLFEKLLERNKKTVIPDDKLLLIWGKIIELSNKIQEKEE